MPSQGDLQNIPIGKVELDLGNPRIAQWIAIYGEKPNAAQIAIALGLGEKPSESNPTTFLSLKASIRTHNGIIHPIIVNKTNKNHYMVIEGNTRVAIYREFIEKDIPGDWETIPAMIHDNLTQEEIDAIRLQSHLVGPRAWDPYSKARYLNFLHNSEYLTPKQIVDYCGGKEKEINNYVAAYEDMERYYRPLLSSDDQFDHTRFSGFVELQRPRVLTALLANSYTKEDFAKWIIEQKIYRNEDVRHLPKVLDDPKGREVFLKTPRRAVEKALLAIEAPTPDVALKDVNLQQLAAEMAKRLNSITLPEIVRLKKEYDSDEVQSLLQLKEILDEFANEMNES